MAIDADNMLPAIDEKEFVDEKGRLKLTRKSLEYLEGFGALYWSTDDIASFFGITDRVWWQAEVANPLSVIAKTIKKGELEQRAKVELGILKDAIDGDEEAIVTYRNMMRDKSFALSKLDLFGGTKDFGAWQKVRDYIENGSTGKLSRKEESYIDLLNLIFSLDRTHGKRNTIKFLTSETFGYTYSQAVNLYSEAMEMFYCNRNISRQALREKTADMYDCLYQAAVAAAKSTADYQAAADILAKRVKLLKLDEAETPQLDPAVYERKPVVLSLAPEDIGLKTADRRKLAEIIDRMPVPESERKRLEVDAGIVDMDIVKMLSDESQEADQH